MPVIIVPELVRDHRRFSTDHRVLAPVRFLKYARSMKKAPRIDLRRYQGQWVALDPKTRVVISAKPSLKAAEEDAKKRGVTKPLLFPIPPSDAFFVGVIAKRHAHQ